MNPNIQLIRDRAILEEAAGIILERGAETIDLDELLLAFEGAEVDPHDPEVQRLAADFCLNWNNDIWWANYRKGGD